MTPSSLMMEDPFCHPALFWLYSTRSTPDRESLGEIVVVAELTYQGAFPVVPDVVVVNAGDVVSILIVLVEIVVLPALSIALKSSVYTPSTVSDTLDCHAPPPPADTCAFARPDVASDPPAEMATGTVLNQPFDPVADGIFGVTTGSMVSRFHVVDPLAVFPLCEAVTVYVIVPFPSGSSLLQVFPDAQLNGVPPMLPEIVRV